MFPTLPSLLSRPYASTVFRVPRVSVNKGSTAVSKNYFTANGARGCTYPSYLYCARGPSPAISPIPVTPHEDFYHGRKSEPCHGYYFLRVGVAGVGLALTFLAAPVIYCDPVPPKKGAAVSPPPAASPAPPPLPPPPQSSVSLYELSFGTVCGVCAGVFVKKGARAVAFIFGGMFVVLQYLGSLSLVRVDWGRAAGRFENLFYTKDPVTGVTRPPNVGSLFRWIVNFLTADFQPRATFIAGFVLGLRIG